MDITDIIPTLLVRGRGAIIRNKRRAERPQGGQRGGPFFLFLLTLFFAPLAFGTTETWSLFTLELLVVLAGIWLFFPFAKAKGTYYRSPGLLALVLLLSWMAFQSLSLPAPLVRMIAPNIFHAYQPVLDLSALPHLGNWIPLTINRKATLQELLRVSSYALFYLITVQLLTSSRRLLRTVQVVSALAVFIAFFSILQRVTAPDTLFWFRKLTEGKTAFGPWVYKNHYAGFMVMLCPLVLSQFVLHRPSLKHGETIREKIVAFFSDNGATVHLFWGFGTVVLLASVFLTQSRGILSIVCGVLLFFFLFVGSREEWERSLCSFWRLVC